MSIRRFGVVVAVLTLVRYAGLLSRFGSAIPSDLGDPLLNTWIIWWNAHNVPFTTQYWNAPAFAPAPYVFALSETLLGVTWLTSPLQWVGASPLMAYNVAFVATPLLNGLSAYWLCSTLTNRRDAAAVGGLAFAFAPYHASQQPHIQTLALYWMPVALVGLHRYWSTGERRWLVCLSAAFALNGFTCGYFLLYFSVFLAIAVAWLAISSGDRRKATEVLTALAAGCLALSPVILTYRSVSHAWNLVRTREDIELFSADALNVFTASDRLLMWPLHGLGFYPQYPGIAIVLVVFGGFFIARRAPIMELPAARWRRRAVILLLSVAAIAISVGLLYLITGPWRASFGPIRVSVSEAYKPVGFGLNLLLVAAALSPRFAALVRSGSLPGLYATGAAVSVILAFGPVGRVYGMRAWYKPPFSWLMPLPGFDSTRVPALFSAITVLCLAVLVAYAVIRLFSHVTRSSTIATSIAAAAIVLDGWIVVPVVDVPRPLSIPVTADLVVELPRRSLFDDVAAMYRGMTHGRPVVNGYSGFDPPHYVYLRDDLSVGCFDSLDAVRGGRSLDVVIWRATDEAPVLDAALMAKWGHATREELPDAIVYHVPGDARSPQPATYSSLDLKNYCLATRPRRPYGPA